MSAATGRLHVRRRMHHLRRRVRRVGPWLFAIVLTLALLFLIAHRVR